MNGNGVTHSKTITNEIKDYRGWGKSRFPVDHMKNNRLVNVNINSAFRILTTVNLPFFYTNNCTYFCPTLYI